MTPPLLAKSKKAEPKFSKVARRKGVPAKIAPILEAAAEQLYPDETLTVLDQRERFEETALRAVTGDAGNLELSFQFVDLLAGLVEKLGLARASDEPDIFRRIWIKSEEGKKLRGVVVRREDGEIAVFCPPSKKRIAPIGELLQLEYRGVKSSISYQLQVNDGVRLPNAYVLHLTRPAGQGAIGRVHKRFVVNLPGFVHRGTSADQQTEPIPCKLKDISFGGVCLKCSAEFERGSAVFLEAFLEDGSAKPFGIECTSSWARTTAEGNLVGLQFGELDDDNRARLEAVLKHLQDEEDAAA